MTGLLEDRKAIREVLLGAGWIVSDRGKIGDRAYLEHMTPQGMFLEILEGASEQTDRFFFFYLSAGPDEVIHLNIHFHDDPDIRDRVIRYLAEHKDEFSPDNYRSHLRSMLKLGPEILVDTEDDLIPLEDDLGSDDTGDERSAK